MNIKLNIYDLFKLGKHLKLNSTKELFDKKLLKFKIGQNGITIPEINFKTSPYKFCPFLINDLSEKMKLKGYCSLHPFIKPLVCILAPISKIFETDKQKSKYNFTKPTENCPGKQVGDNIQVEKLLEPVEVEMIFENIFYNILNIIMEKSIENYKERLYYFNLNDSFITTFDNIRSYYE